LTEYVIEWDGAPVKKVRKAFNAAVKAAKLKGVTPHTLRHTAATWLEESDVDTGRISRLLGHRDRRTTERLYSKPRPSHLQGAADVIDLKLRGKK
jgi:integrase